MSNCKYRIIEHMPDEYKCLFLRKHMSGLGRCQNCKWKDGLTQAEGNLERTVKMTSTIEYLNLKK